VFFPDGRAIAGDGGAAPHRAHPWRRHYLLALGCEGEGEGEGEGESILSTIPSPTRTLEGYVLDLFSSFIFHRSCAVGTARLSDRILLFSSFFSYSYIIRDLSIAT